MIRRDMVAMVLATLLAPAVASAEVLVSEAIQQAPQNSAQGLPRPTPGMSMDRVRARFGDPRQSLGPVGDPPISTWVYDGYSVYFENDRTITAVVHR